MAWMLCLCKTADVMYRPVELQKRMLALAAWRLACWGPGLLGSIAQWPYFSASHISLIALHCA